MKIFEERDGYIKFEADKNVSLSSFVLVKAPDKNYIAQVTQLKPAGEKPVAYGKLLFLYDGSLVNYDNTLPPLNSEIEIFTSEILDNSISSDNPIIVGKTLGESHNIKIDISAFNKKMLVNVDDKTENNIITKNLTKQFLHLHKKTIIIDTLGVINAPKLIAGIDFKLPLNKQTLSFLYQDCLTDATVDSKSTIIEIFRDLAEYSETVPFLPFATLKSIVEDMVDKSHIFKLLVLKNKLIKFDGLGYFANNKQEVEKLNSILESNFIVLDLSQLDVVFQNQYLSYIYDKIKTSSVQPQVLLELSNTVSKKSLKKILDAETIATTFITHSKFKYLNDIKNLFDNFIIVPSLTNSSIFGLFSNFLKAMPKSSYLIVGEKTNYIPLVSNLIDINEYVELKQKDIIKEPDKKVQDEVVIENSIETEETTVPEPTEIEAIVPEESKVDDESYIEEAEQVNPEVIIEPSTEEIIANIEEKSNQAIENAISESLELKEGMNVFDSQDETSEDADDLSELLESESVENTISIQNEEIQSEVETVEEDASSSGKIETIGDESIIENNGEEENDSVESNIIEYTSEDIQEDTVIEESQSDEESLFEELQIPDAVTDDVDASIEELVENDDGSAFDNKIEENDDLLLESATEEQIIISDDIELDLEIDTENNFSDIEEVSVESKTADAIESSFENFDTNFNLLPLEENDEDNFGEITELNPDDATDDDIIIEMEDEIEHNLEDLDEQIIQDVDKVFTTQKEDSISDSDLDFIDELNNDEGVILEELEEGSLDEITEDYNDGILEVSEPYSDNSLNNNEILEKKQATTPFVPVYDADIPAEDLVVSDPIQQGDIVVHAKYGSGIVEKMIKYGNKTLYSINFDNIGRRLLDPTLTEIKRG